MSIFSDKFLDLLKSQDFLDKGFIDKLESFDTMLFDNKLLLTLGNFKFQFDFPIKLNAELIFSGEDKDIKSYDKLNLDKLCKYNAFYLFEGDKKIAYIDYRFSPNQNIGYNIALQGDKLVLPLPTEILKIVDNKIVVDNDKSFVKIFDFSDNIDFLIKKLGVVNFDYFTYANMLARKYEVCGDDIILNDIFVDTTRANAIMSNDLFGIKQIMPLANNQNNENILSNIQEVNIDMAFCDDLCLKAKDLILLSFDDKNKMNGFNIISDTFDISKISDKQFTRGNKEDLQVFEESFKLYLEQKAQKKLQEQKQRDRKKKILDTKNLSDIKDAKKPLENLER